MQIKIIAYFHSNEHAELFEKSHIKNTVEINDDLVNIVHNDNFNNIYDYKNKINDVRLSNESNYPDEYKYSFIKKRFIHRLNIKQKT